ncbi:MAG: hypothetical protein FWD41_05665, partial [Actinomycetia bacterium]|nr:hypothetical protein [Actinomycetes bacterium]
MSPIKYLSVAQTAQKWDLSKRQVQRLLAHNRIDGAIKPGRDWLIPVDTIRPEDMRRRDAVQYRELNIEQMREVDELVISYLRGDFAAVIDFYRRHKDDVVLSLSISFITLPSAIATGDFALLTRIEAFLKDVIAADISQKATIVAELALSGVYVSAFTPDLIPDWLKTGDFSVVPAEFMLDAAFKRAKYYQCLGRFESTLSIAQT